MAEDAGMTGPDRLLLSRLSQRLETFPMNRLTRDFFTALEDILERFRRKATTEIERNTVERVASLARDKFEQWKNQPIEFISQHDPGDSMVIDQPKGKTGPKPTFDEMLTEEDIKYLKELYKGKP